MIGRSSIELQNTISPQSHSIAIVMTKDLPSSSSSAYPLGSPPQSIFLVDIQLVLGRLILKPCLSVFCDDHCEFLDEMKEDPNAFLFTLQNPFNTPPMKFGKSTTRMSAIGCGLQYGPIFGDVTGRADILINNECSKRYGCVINNDGSQGFECNPTHKKSLFVNTSYPNKENYCSITDYEVYCINNYKDYIYSSCQYPDLLWNNIDKHIISEDTWKAHCKSKRFLADLNSLCCYSEAIQSQLLEKPITMPSLFLSSSIIDSSYDQYLNQWLGEDYLWRMIYRASKNNFSPEAFHQCCDEKRPTLVLIKTVEGWIFGEYTTHSWKRTDSDESKRMS